jgi:hypothetical protein
MQNDCKGHIKFFDEIRGSNLQKEDPSKFNTGIFPGVY